MSSTATASSSQASRFSTSERAADTKRCNHRLLTAAQDLPDAICDTRVQLHRTHEAMRQLMSRCQVAGEAVERCTEALASLPTSPNTSFTHSASSTSSDEGNATTAAAASASYRQLYWSLSQFHTHAAQLLSATSLQAYDAAVTDKIANRLSLMERGAATFLQGVVGAQRATAAGGVSVVQGCARQLEQLACTRFAPAYQCFLLYAVATLGDFCALWNTAAQKSVEEVVWSSGLDGRSPMAVPLYSEQTTATPSRAHSEAASEKKFKKTLLQTPAKAAAVHGGGKKRRSSSVALAAIFGVAVCAMEGLRDSIFNYVRLLHATIEQLNVAALTLTRVLSAVLPGTMSELLAGCLNDIDYLGTTLANSHIRMATRRACYEAIMEDVVLRPLRQLQEDSKKGVHFGTLFDAMNYPLMEKTSTALERALRRLTEPRSKEHVYHPSRTSSVARVPSSPLEVLFSVWYKTSELCTQVGTEVSEEFAKRVDV